MDTNQVERNMAEKSATMDAINQTTFARTFFPRLPALVRNDIKRKVQSRAKRKNATKENMSKAANDAVKFGLKCAGFIEDKFSFVDSRNKAKTEPLSHDILMRDDAVSKFASLYADKHNNFFDAVNAEDNESFSDAMTALYLDMASSLQSIHLVAPYVNFDLQSDPERIQDFEEMLTVAVLKMVSEKWLERRLLKLRAQYVEYAQIALCRVGDKKHQSRYVSDITFSNWTHKQRESADFMASMSVLNQDTNEHFKLEEVAKRTVSNPENRRIEMMVRSRGFEELAEEYGYTALFITWTLPSKYHRNSYKWNGATVKEGHSELMRQWALARANLAKSKIEYFGFRVAEPHKDATSHAHYFLFCRPEKKQKVISTLRAIATDEDREELGKDVSARFDVKEADPSKGGATAYIAKYISKNINGKHMPESEAEKNAFKVRAWASVHGIRQFQQFGGAPVTLWRTLRRTKPEQTQQDKDLDELRQAADSSKWALFCRMAGEAKIQYEKSKNDYGETVGKIVGFTWRESVYTVFTECYSLVKSKDVQRLLESRSGSPWSTENNCNSQLTNELVKLTGWSLDGVKCLLNPLKRGATIPIDQDCTIKMRNNGLIVT
ncbi:replication endonuclease [Vibrio kanaloae]|nr:replication endonuclease [Vibrio kanaloae]